MITPRVNSASLSDFGGKTVRIVGKVLRLEGETALLEASDQGHVTIRLSRTANLADQYVEIIGRVNAADNSIQEYTATNLGDNIDMSMVDAVVRITAQLPEVFPVE